MKGKVLSLSLSSKFSQPHWTWASILSCSALSCTVPTASDLLSNQHTLSPADSFYLSPSPPPYSLPLSLSLSPSSFSHLVTEALFKWILYLCCTPEFLPIGSCSWSQQMIQDQWYCVARVLEVCMYVCCVFVCTLTFALLLGPEVFHNIGDITALSQFFLPLAQLLHIWTSPDL